MKKVEVKEVQKTLRDARDLMNHNGTHWTKGRLRKRIAGGETSFCSLGGIYEAISVRGGNWSIPIKARPSALALANAILESQGRKQLDPTHDPTHRLFTWNRVAEEIIFWNDSSGRKWSQVRTMFGKAARSAKRYMKGYDV